MSNVKMNSVAIGGKYYDVPDLVLARIAELEAENERLHEQRNGLRKNIVKMMYEFDYLGADGDTAGVATDEQRIRAAVAALEKSNE